MKKAFIGIATLVLALTMPAQAQNEVAGSEGNKSIKLLKNLDLALTVGTEGLGFDFATPVTDWAQVRIGGTFMPSMKYNMNFNMEMENVSPEDQDSKFNKMADLMEGFCGVRPERFVRMQGNPKFSNLKVLVDFYPFKENKHWHATAGFYWGSGNFADALVAPISMNSLVAVGMFNAMYKRSMGMEPLIEYEDISVYNEEIQNKFRQYGLISVSNGFYSHDIIATQDIYWEYTYVDDDLNTIHQRGDLKYKKGEVIHKKGDPFRFMPDENNILEANAHANSFKPYLGFGYNTALSKDKKTQIAFDAGVMLWGGSPSIMVRNPEGQDANGKVLYQHIDMIGDLEGTKNKVGDYIRFAKNVVAYPVVSIRLSHRLF